jgi:hypothetical protein
MSDTSCPWLKMVWPAQTHNGGQHGVCIMRKHKESSASGTCSMLPCSCFCNDDVHGSASAAQ